MALMSADIQRAFQNSLGRAPSQSELNAYLVASQGGTGDTQIYETISNSREADLNVDPVVRLYQAVFGRVPDKAGLDNATDFIRAFGASAQTYEALASQFEQSPEFQARYGTSTGVDATYVQALYRDILGREPSTAEVAGYVSGANGYNTRGEVLYAISQSNEAIGRADVFVNAYLQNAAKGDATYTGPLYPETTPTQPTDPTEPTNPGGGGNPPQPVNSVPVAVNDTLATVNEDSGPRVITAAELVGNDTDADSDGLRVAFVTSGTGGTAALNADGSVTFTPTANFNGTANFTYVVTDGTATSNAATVSFSVASVNDAPSFTVGTNQTVNEDAAAQTVANFITGISAGPDEAGQTVSFLTSNTNNSLFAVGPSISADGTLTYTLAADANGSATVSVSAQDNGGTANGGIDTSAAQTFTITANAVNDAPTAMDLSQLLTISEDAAATKLFTVAPTVADIDSTSVTVTLTLANTAAGELIGAGTGTAANGATTYTITGTPDVVQTALRAVQFDSAENFNGSVNVSVAISDGANGSQGTNPTGSVVITVTGVNDAAVITGAVTNTATEDQAGATTGTLVATDPDAGQNTFTASNGTSTYGTFALQTDGTYTYTLGNGAQALTAGQTVTDTFSVTSIDGTASSVAITVTGVNDAPVIGGNTSATGTEDQPTITGALTITDADTDQSVFVAQTNTAGTYGTFDLQTGGGYIYNVGTAAQTLAAGQTGTDTFTAVSADGTTQLVTINVTGVNDSAVIGGALANTATEDQAGATAGTLTVTDVDTGQATFQAQANTAGNYGSFTLAQGGGYTYTLDGRAQALAGGQVVTDTFAVASADGTPSSVVITVTGVNDAPIITSVGTGAVAENAATSTIVYQASATDVDVGDTITYSLTGTDAGAFNIDASGAVRLNSSANFEAKSTYDINVVATDGGTPVLSASKAVVVSVTDVNDVAPTFTSSATPSVAENTKTVITLTSTDPDTVGGPTAYTIIGGADQAKFEIVSGNQLQFITAPDFEASGSAAGTTGYAVEVSANDGTNATTQNLAVTVTDVNESVFSITALDASKPEGDTGTTPYTFTVSRTGSLDADATLNYAVTGTATDGASAPDFVGGTLPSGQVTILAGQTSATLTINVSGDTTFEQNEGFAVTLTSPPANGTISTGAGSASGTIQNDDGAPSTLNYQFYTNNTKNNDFSEGNYLITDQIEIPKGLFENATIDLRTSGFTVKATKDGSFIAGDDFRLSDVNNSLPTITGIALNKTGSSFTGLDASDVTVINAGEAIKVDLSGVSFSTNDTFEVIFVYGSLA